MRSIDLRWNPRFCDDNKRLKDPKFFRDWFWGLKHVVVGLKNRWWAVILLMIYALLVVAFENIPGLLCALIERALFALLAVPIVASAWAELRSFQPDTLDTKYRSDRLIAEQQDGEPGSDEKLSVESNLFGNQPYVDPLTDLSIFEGTLKPADAAKDGSRGGPLKSTAESKPFAMEPNFFSVCLIYAMSVGLLTLLIVVPGMWFATTRSMSLMFVFAYKRTLVEAFSASENLVKNHFWRTYFYMVFTPTAVALTVVVLALIPCIVSSVLSPSNDVDPILLNVFGFFIAIFLLIFQLACIPTMAYFFGWLIEKRLESKSEMAKR